MTLGGISDETNLPVEELGAYLEELVNHAVLEKDASPDGFDVYCGDDWATLAFVCLGGVGVVSVASHLVGDRMRHMIELATSGDVPGARKVNEELLPLYKALFVTSNPIPLKAALEIAGRPVGPPRLPLVPATPEERQHVEAAMREVGVL